jgi:hypothetical protein
MKTKTRNKKSWKNKMYVDAYIFSSQGMNDAQIAGMFGVSGSCIKLWKEKRPTFRYAIEKGRGKVAENSVASYHQYVYQRLPTHLQELWNKIEESELQDNGIDKIESMLANNGKYARMHLFMYAFSASNFNPSEACKKVNITFATLRRWERTEPGFLELLDQMLEHKKNFFEACLVKAAKKGDVNAIIFANKSLNKDRGYADTAKVEHTGTIKHEHSHKLINLDDLDLPLSVRKAILDALRAKGLEQPIPSGVAGVIDYKMNGNKAVPLEDSDE